jgi:hypothetical protein
MDLTMSRGKLKQWTILLTNPDGTPYNPAGHALIFVAKYTPADATPVITESTTNGNITISGTTPFPVTITVPPVDTSTLPNTALVLLYEVDEDPATLTAPEPLLSGRLVIGPTLD